MGLQTYRKKRKFGITPEPRGSRARKRNDLYVVQKHAARRLHYDFRLELDGVLKSWAVAKGPSLVAGEKRLAVHVEDHPLEYGDFEGTIPESQYGGGTVMLWDCGRWTPEGDPHAGYEKGHLTFVLEGKKLKGRWHLVRMRSRPKERQESWLLIKGDDKQARTPTDPDILEQKPHSVATRRSLDEITEGKKPKIRSTVKAAAVWNSVARSEHAAKASAVGSRAKAKAETRLRAKSGSARLPDFIAPCLAALKTRPPDDSGWVHEIKVDGYRMQARLDHGRVKLKTRKGLDWTKKFETVAAAISELPADTALIDGELVVEDENGVSHFSMLQSDLKEGRRDRFVYLVFDLLHLNGTDLTTKALVERKSALKKLIGDDQGKGPLRFSAHLDDPGSVVLQHACRMSLEGIISKRRDAPYRSGRTGDWIKTKCSNRQEFVVAGFSPSTASPRAVGALVAGYYENGKLRYAGRIGTGYSHKTAIDLWKQLDKLKIAKPAFDHMPAEERRRRDVVWVKPQLVIEADFRGWTHGQVLRQAAFKGVREDKTATEVVREEPADMTTIAPKRSRAAARTPARTKKGLHAKASHTKPAPTRARTPAPQFGTVKLTHPDRVYWDDAGITKLALAEFYADIWDWIAPHIVRRPLALLRCPEGVGEPCFVQKHAHATFQYDRILRLDDRGEEIIAIDDLNGLIALVQAGVLEVHVWGSTIDRIDICDRMVFDLDPGRGVEWATVIEATREVRDRLKAVGLESFVKTSGGKGMHVVVPFDGADWMTTKKFAHQIALQMTADSPASYVAKMTKNLRHGRIFVDYLRNGRGATAVAAYSPRARAGAPVSTPVDWREVKPSLTADRFTILNLRQRLKGLRKEPWAGIGKIKQKLPR